MIDCFMFRDELDLLEIRLNTLAPYIDKFVLVESDKTWTGIAKPLYFQENKGRFKNFKIIHLIYKYSSGNPWHEERTQRQFISEGIKNEMSDTIILISDIDEIPNLENYKSGTECVFKHKLYYYYVNTTNRQILRGTVALRKQNWRNIPTIRHRRYRLKLPIINGGWHFSTLGSKEQIIQKIEACAHQEFNTFEIKSKVSERLWNLIDLYGRSEHKFSIEMPFGLNYLLVNKEKYNHLFYKKPPENP